MDQNQTAENQVLNQATDNDLQRAIDDITNTTNVDPVFSDPVAAPSSVPEGDTGELGEPVGPFPQPQVEMVAPAPEPMAPIDGISIPDLSVPAPAPAPMPEAMMPNMTQEPAAPTAPALAPEPMPVPMPEPAPAQIAPEPAPMLAPEPVATPESTAFEHAAGNLSTHQVKEAALRDLVPLLDRLNMDSTQKFNLYRNIFEDLKDYTVLDPAYKAAKEIPDDTARAEALLYLVESIDRM